MAARMYNINCSSARHFEAFADIQQELAFISLSILCVVYSILMEINVAKIILK
jgi:hypothetical protein